MDTTLPIDLVFRDQWTSNFFPPRRIADNCHALVSRGGRLCVLDDEEARQTGTVAMTRPLFERLAESGHILTEDNAAAVLRAQRLWHRHHYGQPSHFIVSVTRRCNQDCHHCHMNPVAPDANRSTSDFPAELVAPTAAFVADTAPREISVEFQGGEAFLAFDRLRELLHAIREACAKAGKTVSFSVVSNLLTLREAWLEFCVEESVEISYSLNGTRDAHDRLRPRRGGGGSFDAVMSSLQRIKRDYPELATGVPLCVIDGERPGEATAAVDFLAEAGFEGVAFIRRFPLGQARDRLPVVSAEAFIREYLGALERIVERNDRFEVPFGERLCAVLLAKIIGDVDPPFVDWRNPVGDVNSTLVIDYDGTLLPNDFARSNRERFALGNVREARVAEVTASEAARETMNASLRAGIPECLGCAYNTWCGVSPVIEYARSGEIVPRPHLSEECQITLAVFDWLLRRLQERPIPLLRTMQGFDGWMEAELARFRARV